MWQEIVISSNGHLMQCSLMGNESKNKSPYRLYGTCSYGKLDAHLLQKQNKFIFSQITFKNYV